MSVVVGLFGLLQVFAGIIFLISAASSPITIGIGVAAISFGLLLYGVGVVIWHLSGIKAELKKLKAI